MADFGGNFRGGRTTVFCPFSCLLPDNQQHSYVCRAVTQTVDIVGEYDNLLLEDVPNHAGTDTLKIVKARKSLKEERYLSDYSGPCAPLCAA